MTLAPLQGRSARERRDFNSERFPSPAIPRGRFEIAVMNAAIAKRERRILKRDCSPRESMRKWADHVWSITPAPDRFLSFVDVSRKNHNAILFVGGDAEIRGGKRWRELQAVAILDAGA